MALFLKKDLKILIIYFSANHNELSSQNIDSDRKNSNALLEYVINKLQLVIFLLGLLFLTTKEQVVFSLM